MQRVRHILFAAPLCLLLTAAARADEDAAERFEVLHAGSTSYSNVLIMNKTRTDVFLRHAGGLTSVKVKDLEKTTQLQLGYHVVVDAPPDGAARADAGPAFSGLELDPRYEEIAEQIIWETQEFVAGLDRNVIYGAIGGVVLLYLLFCYCCHLLCRKTGQPASALVWLPWLKLLPLLRAAGMRPWWLATTLIPGINVITYVVWSFKITRARGKGAVVSVLLLLPVFNVLAFLYLAFADRLGRAEPAAGSRKVIMLSQPQRRNAA